MKQSNGNSPPGFTQRVLTDTLNGAFGVRAADFDLDGDQDVVANGFLDGGLVVWFENDGAPSPTFTEHFLSDLPEEPAKIFAVDVNDDGDVDVITHSNQIGQVIWFENDGANPPNFTPCLLSPQGCCGGLRAVRDTSLGPFPDIIGGTTTGRISVTGRLTVIRNRFAENRTRGAGWRLYE